MKCLVCLLVWCSLISYISSQCLPEDDGNLSETTYRFPNVPDTTRGDFYIVQVPGLSSITVTITNEFLIANQPEDEAITFSLSEAFENYEALTTNTVSPLPLVPMVRVRLTCESSATSELVFSLTIDDINNNPPVFTQSEYRYKLPMPFPSNLEITQFADEIIAEDIDITNMGITFSINSDQFVISNAGTTDTLLKNHKATIVASSPLQFTETMTFEITATDWGTDPGTLSSTAYLIIEVDQENSATSPPMFDEPYHEVEYDDTADTHVASVTMSMTNGDSTECELEGEYADYFACSRIDNEVTVTLTTNLEEEDIAQGGYRVLVVAAIESETRFARTVIILQIPDPITTTTACPTEPTETTTTCEVCEVCTTPTPEECICTTTEISTTECATETTVTLTTCEPCECTTTEAVTCPDIEEILSTACPTTTTEVSSTMTTCAPCECTTSEAVTCPPIEEILSTACPTITPDSTLPVTSCEPCESSTTETVTCPSIDDILSTACPSTSTDTTIADTCETCDTCEECVTVTCDPCVCSSTSPSVDPDDVTPCPEQCPEVCSETTPCDCTEVSTETDCSSAASTECPVCPETTPYDCPETSTGSFDCSTICTTLAPECPVSCSETTPCDCQAGSTDGLDSTACPTLPPVDCSVCPSDCSTTETLDCSAVCSTESPECSEPTPCECSESSTAPLDCPTTSPPVVCPESTPCESSTEPLDCSACTTLAPIESCSEPTPCECSESSTAPLDCSTASPPIVCPESTPCESSTEPLDCSACTTLAPIESCSEPTPCECSESSTAPVDCSTPSPPESTPCESATEPLDCSACTTLAPIESCSEPTPCECSSEPTPCECSDSSTTILDCSMCTTIVTECPLDCSECPTDCSDCTDEICETAPPDAVLAFIGSTFDFIITTYEGMSTYYLPVGARSNIEETITYTADGLPDQLILDSGFGMINNEDLLPAGLYEFTVTATGDLSGASVTQPVTITVVAVEVCADGARVTYSLLVKNIEENSAQILLPSAYPDENIAYILEINDVSPSAGAGRFYVSEDGQSIGCQELDRESSDFADMAVTQYTVTITVTELDGEEVTNQNYRNNVARISNETYVQSLASSRADSEQYILINDILNSPTRTIITIIVEDVNDNPPVFPLTSMVVGYPSSTLLSVIAPPYIVQVEATDDDIGINAELAYEVSDSTVIIHSSSGIIYPTDGMPDNDFTFTVTATDQNGEGLPSSNSLQVQVKILGEEHISILTLENVFLEDIDAILSELSRVANVDIKQLTASVLPSTTITNRQLRADEKYYLIITVYALDSSNDLVTTEQLQEALADVTGLSVDTITVDSDEVCDGARVTYSLLVKNIEENSAQILLPSAYPDENIAYILEINDVSPSAGAGRFYVSEDGQSIGCQALDRESSDFAGMAVTQYTVTISVTELDEEEVTNQNYRNNVARTSNETYAQSLASSRADSEQYILINDILNSPTRTIITIIVEDVNDNRPVFPVTSMVVGYPSSTLLSVIAPPYIVQVEATDDDIGINAELAYEVSDSPVIIHSSSGIVYPTDGMPDNDFTFTVRATDQNGEGLLSSNSLQVQVKILGEEHISILTLENVVLENIDEQLSRLSQVANVDIKQLAASVLPSTTITNRQLRADEKYYLIITVYALDSSNDLVTTEQLQEALANVAGLSVVTLPKASSDGNSSDNSSDSNTGLIAAVAVLAAILLLLLIGFLAFYYFRLRKNKPHDHMTEENAPSTGTSTPPQYQKNIAMTRSSSKLSHLGQDIEKMERRPTGILITGAVGAPDDDSPPVSPPKERRKSVVFNANVEQINIDTSRDSDDGIESSKL